MGAVPLHVPACSSIPADPLLQSFGDKEPSVDVVTGTGDTLPDSVGTKRLHDTSDNPAAKGHPRDDKASKQKRADQELGAVDQVDAEE